MNLLRHFNFGLVAIVIVLLGSVAAFFGSPGVFNSPDIASSSKELNSFSKTVESDPGFGDRVVDSTWAMVLTHSEFSGDNASGLEALRNWAKHEFTKDRQFLNPVILPRGHSRSTVMGAFFNSIFDFPYQVFESASRSYLNWRIEEFHKTSAYHSFRVDYYELFGINKEAISLLAKYQEYRAKESISVLLNFVFGILAAASIFIAYLFGKAKRQPGSARKALAYSWIGLSAFYLVNGCGANNVEALAGSFLSFVTGLYVLYPTSIISGENQGLKWERKQLSPRTITFIFWVMFSLAGIQVINWIKGGILTDPDPLTLFIGATSGNFIHDPIAIKRTIMEIIGILWLSLTVWAIYFYKSESGRSREIETELRSLSKQKVGIQ